MKYLELIFFTYYTVDAKRPKKLVKGVFHFCFGHYQPEEILYISKLIRALCVRARTIYAWAGNALDVLLQLILDL